MAGRAFGGEKSRAGKFLSEAAKEEAESEKQTGTVIPTY
jgi:hypothetical protein